jgi:hypothetical protein
VSLRALRLVGNYAYVKFDALVQIFEKSFNFNAMYVPLPIVVSSLLPSIIELHPPLSDPHVLHTLLELRNLCITRFKPSWITCATHVSRVGSEWSHFWTASE